MVISQECFFFWGGGEAAHSYIKYSYLKPIILFNHYLFSKLYGSAYSYPMLIICKHLFDLYIATLTSIATSAQIRPKINSDEGVLHTTQIFRCSLVSYLRHFIGRGSLAFLQGDTVCVFFVLLTLMVPQFVIKKSYMSYSHLTYKSFFSYFY